MKRKQKKLDAFFPRNVLPCTGNHLEEEVQVVPRALNLGIDELSNVVVNEDSLISPRVTNPSFALIERDPGLRKLVWTFPPNKRDEIRRAYLSYGPLQVKLPNFPRTGDPDHPRGFQVAWYSEFPWVEYSESKDAAYCLPCYLFAEKPIAESGWDTFVNEGF
ncbi:unnamed protein product [Linum trigynum]|uniref:Uncharacterized protein n=1 Tax=Linum trigynum TaxID=586398 RepID=A0AAV2FMT8_9ROSI